jgi:hypothetical protein
VFNNVPQRHRKNRQQCPTEASEKQATMSHRGSGKTGNNVPQRHRKNRQQCPTEASEKQATMSHRGIGKTGNNVSLMLTKHIIMNSINRYEYNIKF